MNWWEYVKSVADANQTEIAYRLNLAPTSIWRWREKTPKPENVAAFARAYDRPVLEAFVAAGYLSEDDIQHKLIVDRKPEELTTKELVREVERRLKRAESLANTPAEIPMHEVAAGVRQATEADAGAELEVRESRSRGRR